MQDSKTLFCVSKFPWARGRISWKFVDNLGTRPQKRFSSPALRKEYNLEISKCYSKNDYLFGHCWLCWGLQSGGSESDLYPSSGIKGVVQLGPSKEGWSQSLDTKRSLIKGQKPVRYCIVQAPGQIACISLLMCRSLTVLWLKLPYNKAVCWSVLLKLGG
jgi:hypothetical protein